MIDGLMKDVIDPVWEAMARPLVRARLTPNQVTALGLALIVLVSTLYLWHGSHWVYGLTLAVAFVFDALDGAVARQRGMSSRLGGYFDAMVDRYQELIVLAAIAWVTGLWALALLAFSGAMLTSYAKARAAIETPVSNTDWPDLFERLERIVYLCVLLVLAGLVPWAWLLPAGLAVYAALCHLTALQRARRAARILRAADRDGPRH
ncbi:CDP-alcohol phosphatidyltransferase family protein [Psychromarinibacter sp. C21-152]|uniref:CDP-alcohol phosphatidyltransferase family protein n=1 Tax=Psychromarinibacter sediminicola TaxID=3033385 RepID=A0AAE3T779_9RHOB|nr:CDP-alcohol phosphatidyltransferase family protein [Psychromarinibacter sediminicola]MDF0600037.1 CDP-alcohol phosphatidyltransferase family protein [Psychromarinibacter sediminicola]